MSKQVQLRGGTKDEHRQFIGANREVTVDTSKKTLRVHDGHTYGGTVLATEDMVYDNVDSAIKYIDSIVDNIAEAHNHDDTYSQLDHRHDDLYERKLNGTPVLRCKPIGGYFGMSCNGNDDAWIRTTRNGLIPYQSGGYSSIGTSSWRFNDGWFNNINTKTITVAKNGDTSCIEFPGTVNDPGFIRHIENNNTAGMYFSVSDDDSYSDAFYFGASPNGQFRQGAWISADGHMWLHGYLRQDHSVMNVGGRYVYFDGSRPSDAPEGSISFG